MLEKLEMRHQFLLEEKFQRLNINISEYNFANLYLFRAVHEYEVLRAEELFIKGKMRDGASFLIPTSSPQIWKKSVFEFLWNRPESLFPIPQEWLKYFENCLQEFSFNEGESDYIFAAAKIAHYPGRHLSGKRNLVKQFLENYQSEAIPYHAQYAEEALKILEAWQSGSTLEKEKTDYYSFVEAIHLSDQLHLSGRWYKVNGVPKGIILGEWLNPGCFALHFVKASREIRGLYQFMYQDFARSVEKECQWLNFEQDLGISALRQAKNSYQPDDLIHKYKIRLKRLFNA